MRIALMIAAAALGCGRADTADKFAARAARYANEGRYEAAAIEYRNAIKRRPEWADAHRELADVQIALGNPETAYAAYREACHLAPSDARACLDEARLLLSAGRAKEAERRAQALVDRAPADVDARLLLASAAASQGRFSRAARILDTAIAIDHRPAAYAALGDVRAATGDLAAAEAAFRSAVDRWPGSPEARVNLARFLAKVDRPDEAERQLLDATAADPDDELANRALASLYVAMDRLDAAEPYLRRAAAQPNQKYRSFLALADFLAGAQRWSEAIAALDRAPREGALAWAAKVRMAGIQYETGDTETAHRTLKTVLKQKPTARAWALNAQFLARERRFAEALDSARTAAALQPDLAEAHRLVAAIERQRGSPGEAGEALRAVPSTP